MGMKANVFLLCCRKHFKLLLELSMEILHSAGSYPQPIAFKKPLISSQNTNSSSILKNCTKSLSLLRQKLTTVPGANKFVSFNLEASNSAEFFGRSRSLTKSFKSACVNSWGIPPNPPGSSNSSSMSLVSPVGTKSLSLSEISRALNTGAGSWNEGWAVKITN